jgi:protein TonB
MVFTAVFFLSKTAEETTPLPTPVQIVNLPPYAVKRLPPIERPVPVPQRAIPAPRKFGTSEEVKLPKTMPPAGKPSGAEGGKAEKGKAAPGTEQGPLPFLSQADIEELARKGMPEKKPGDDSVTLDTNEFKYISYNRWLDLKWSQAIRYPELAARSGMQGYLYVKIDILKDGSVGSIEILKSSGYKILDDEIVRTIRAAEPYPPLPEEWHTDHYSITGIGFFYLGSAYIR